MEKRNKCILVTGGAGYVASHTVLELLKIGYDVVAMDNFSNSCGAFGSALPESLKRVERITGRKLTKFYEADLLNEKTMDRIFDAHDVDAVIHFAALKAVGESCQLPLAYYKNNVGGTVILLEVMRKHGVKSIIFSSSATVYGLPTYLPIDESHPTGQNLTNPYGKTKYMVEEVLKDVASSDEDWCVTSLRYFNPVGAHESGDIGEDPRGIPNNLMPYLSQVAVGRRPHLNVYGSDFDTPDGTGVRDYVHIVDLAVGHVAAVNKMFEEQWTGWRVFNLGTGRGHSVLEVIAAFEQASGISIPYKIADRRTGDVTAMYSDVKLANQCLGWTAKYTMADMCLHTWNWQTKNPNGYRKIDDNDNIVNFK